MKNAKFYICPRCGNIVDMIKDSGVKPVCCGQPMEELVANSVEASGEKHIPAVSVMNNAVEVNVGSVDHPMAEEHFIEWVQLVTDQGSQRKYLKPGQTPKVRFLVDIEQPQAVYAYCNLHGLWKSELN